MTLKWGVLVLLVALPYTRCMDAARDEDRSGQGDEVGEESREGDAGNAVENNLESDAARSLDLPGPREVALQSANAGEESGDDFGGFSPTGAEVQDLQDSKSDLHVALKTADDRMAKLEDMLRVEEAKLAQKSRLRLQHSLQMKRLRAIELEASKRKQVESIRQAREDKILKGFTDFRAHMDECLQELKGGANHLYLKIKATLWSIPATKVCLQFKMMKLPDLPIHGFTHKMENFNITADEDGSQDLYLTSKKQELFDCMCHNNPIVGSDLSVNPLPPPVDTSTQDMLRKMVNMDLTAIAKTFHSAVEQDINDIVG